MRRVSGIKDFPLYVTWHWQHDKLFSTKLLHMLILQTQTSFRQQLLVFIHGTNTQNSSNVSELFN